MQFVDSELFGGAMAVELPVGYGDVSNIRQVPDTQEVFLDGEGFTSIVFDITERLDATQATSDEEALKYHFQDIIGDDTDDVTQFWQSSAARLEKMPTLPAYTLLATQHPSAATTAAAKNMRTKPQPDFTAILLLLVRLEQQKTDIVITVNVPHPPDAYPKESVNFAENRVGPLTKDANEIRQKVLETFEIRDWSLFVNAE